LKSQLVSLIGLLEAGGSSGAQKLFFWGGLVWVIFFLYDFLIEVQYNIDTIQRNNIQNSFEGLHLCLVFLIWADLLIWVPVP
jgi:hypothetical protein